MNTHEANVHSFVPAWLSGAPSSASKRFSVYARTQSVGGSHSELAPGGSSVPPEVEWKAMERIG